MIAKAAAIAHGSTNVRYSTEKDLSEIVKGLLTIPSCLGSWFFLCADAQRPLLGRQAPISIKMRKFDFLFL